MSTIAALLVASLATAPPGDAPLAAKSLTAEQVLAAHRVATSIGRDPCLAPSEDEIVVCARRRETYALPFPGAGGDPATRYGGDRERQMGAIREASGACAMQGALCTPPASVDFVKVFRGVRKIFEALTDGE